MSGSKRVEVENFFEEVSAFKPLFEKIGIRIKRCDSYGYFTGQTNFKEEMSGILFKQPYNTWDDVVIISFNEEGKIIFAVRGSSWLKPISEIAHEISTMSKRQIVVRLVSQEPWRNDDKITRGLL